MANPAVPAFSIRDHRLQLSPFYACYAVEKASLGIYNQRLYPWSLGDDRDGAYWALRRKAVLYDVPEMPIEIIGADAVTLLNRVLTRDVSKMRVGRAAYGLACLPDGGILMDGVLMRLGLDRFWYVQADGPFFTWLVAHAIGLDVKIRDPQSWVLQIQGPRALDIVTAAADAGPPEQFRYFDVRECAMGGQPLIISRTGWTGELGFEVYTGADTDGLALWRHISQAGAPFGLIHSGLDSMAIRRIESGILDNGSDINTAMTPFQAGLGRFVDFDKPDFIGKTALAAADRQTLIYGLECTGATPARWGEVRHGGRPVGCMTTSAWSPFLKRGIGYVRLNQPGDWNGVEVSVETDGGTAETAAIIPLPFYDPEKKIARGLETMTP